MDILELLSSYGKLVGSAISAVVGGGLVSAYNAYRKGNRKRDGQQHTQAMDLSTRLENRLTSVEGRLDAAEDELRKTQKQLTESQIRREELSAAIDTLVQRIDRLISRLATHEQITDKERDELTSIPFVSKDDSPPK